MPNKRLETWVWISIYAGMAVFSLGWFLEARSAAVGLGLMVGGGLAAAVGVVLIFVRSARGEES